MEMLPLIGVRVLDLTDGLAESAGRFLADLGADVVRVEPPTGSRSRACGPFHGEISIPFALRNANKRGVTVDLTTDEGNWRFAGLVRNADILIDSPRPDGVGGSDMEPAELLALNPALVAVSVTGFGRTGPYRDWAATESVIYALSGVLSRSGEPGREPLLPPSGLVEHAVGAHVAWSALLAYYSRLHTGTGQLIDISALEVIVHGFDPGFGVQGSAAAGRKVDFPRGRPDAAGFYPVFDCADGRVRICLLAKRQWRSMFSWLGEPEEFADPVYDTIPGRFGAADRLHPLIEKLFVLYTRDELVAEGAARGIPIGGVLTVGEVLAAEHYGQSGAFADEQLADGVPARVPAGYATIDGHRAGWRHRAPAVGEHNAEIGDSPIPEPAAAQADTPSTGVRARPFDGLRVLDLGVIVFGAELGRQFADNGADVIKVENTAFPDGLRQSKRGAALSPSVAWGHRNRRSIGLNLREPEGRRLFRELAATADIVLANFKPGTLASMGIAYEDLSAINDRIVVAESSAFGNVGPWRARLGYGPLVRAACGVSDLWRYDADYRGLCDGSTVYPDHIAAQVSAATVLAVLIAREKSGRGAHIDVAQADTAIMQLGEHLVREALNPGTVEVTGNDDPFAAPSGVYHCAGDDEWCVVTVRDDADWGRLCEAIGRADMLSDPDFATAANRIANRRSVEEPLLRWLSQRTPTEAMTALQEAGVPAAVMKRLPELLIDPHLEARSAYAELTHPLLPSPLPTATRIAHFQTVPDAPLRPAPLAGEQTRQIASELLGLTDPEVDRLVAAGILQPAPEPATTG